MREFKVSVASPEEEWTTFILVEDEEEKDGKVKAALEKAKIEVRSTELRYRLEEYFSIHHQVWLVDMYCNGPYDLESMSRCAKHAIEKGKL